jgi:hypothetical protein
MRTKTISNLFKERKLKWEECNTFLIIENDIKNFLKVEINNLLDKKPTKKDLEECIMGNSPIEDFQNYKHLVLTELKRRFGVDNENEK